MTGLGEPDNRIPAESDTAKQQQANDFKFQAVFRHLKKLTPEYRAAFEEAVLEAIDRKILPTKEQLFDAGRNPVGYGFITGRPKYKAPSAQMKIIFKANYREFQDIAAQKMGDRNFKALLKRAISSEDPYLKTAAHAIDALELCSLETAYDLVKGLQDLRSNATQRTAA